MRRPTSGWTDGRVPLAVAMVAASLGAVLAAPAPYPPLAVGVVVATSLAGLGLDAFGGLVAGVAGSAVVVATMRSAGAWTQESFPRSLGLVIALVVLGWSAGAASATLRRRPAREPVPGGAGAPAFGSLGLLPAEVAEDRLDEEVLRARRHGRPLTVVVVRVDVLDRLDAAARDSARRTVARLVESEFRDTDVPFALAPDEVGAILPETDVAVAWEVVGPVLDAATRATVTVREQDERRPLVDCADLHVGLAGMSERLPDGATLLAAAQASARADRSHARGGGGPVPEAAP